MVPAKKSSADLYKRPGRHGKLNVVVSDSLLVHGVSKRKKNRALAFMPWPVKVTIVISKILLRFGPGRNPICFDYC
jgi:hypothetical protein